MVQVVERLHKLGENHPTMDALPGKIFMHVTDIIVTGIKCKLKIYFYLNDHQPQIVDKINRQGLCAIQVTQPELYTIKSRLQLEQVSHSPSWIQIVRNTHVLSQIKAA